MHVERLSTPLDQGVKVQGEEVQNVPPPPPSTAGTAPTPRSLDAADASAAAPSSTRASQVPGAVSIDLTGGLFLLAALALLIWFSRMIAGLASIISSWRQVHRLKSGAEPIDPMEWSGLVPAIRHRSFEVAESPDVTSPVAAGLRDPMILIPQGLRDRLTTDEFRQVLMHEVAHLERFDDWTILAQRIGEALLWHHPAMWKVSSELQDAREIACDDWVVSRTRRPEAYVHSIGRMIELNLGTRSLQLSPGLAANRGDLMSRMRRLLNGKLPESSRLSGEQIAVAGGLVGLVLVLVAVFVPLTRLVFSAGHGEAMTYVFGDDSDQAVQLQEAPARAHLSEELPPLAPLPPLPSLPELPDLPEIPPFAAVAETPPPPPRATSAVLHEEPPPPPVPAGSLEPATAPPPPIARRSSSGDELSVRSWIRVFESVSKVSSNGERAEVLRTALVNMPDDDRVLRGWLDAVDGLSSSGAQAELLAELIERYQLTSDRIDWIRNVTASIRSRGDRERVMRAVSDKL